MHLVDNTIHFFQQKSKILCRKSKNFLIKCVAVYHRTILQMALRRMLVFEQVVEASPRRDKHTPCIKTNRLKRQNRSRAERAVRAKPLANRARFSRTSAMRFFCPLFHRRIFFSFYIKLRIMLFVFSASELPLEYTLICVFPFKFPLNIYFFNVNFP